MWEMGNHEYANVSNRVYLRIGDFFFFKCDLGVILIVSTYSTILPLQGKGRSGRNENKEIEKRNLICLSGKFHVQAYVLK